jgi:hypothetical protein
MLLKVVRGTQRPCLPSRALHAPLSIPIAKTNAHLPENAKVYIGLHNGAKNAVVVGPARSLYGHVTALRKVRAPAGADQSEIPYSQRKNVFAMRFLVNVPYHSDYLPGTTDKVFDIDLEGKELWTPDELAVPVFHTENGACVACFGIWQVTAVCFCCFELIIHSLFSSRLRSAPRLLLRSRARFAIRRSYTPYIGLKPPISLNLLRTLSTSVPVGSMELAH